MARPINITTGEATARFGFRGTDLGYFTLTNHGYCLATFGDTFNNLLPGGDGWRSPVILRQSNRNLDMGLRWDNAVGGSYAKQALPYAHASKDNAYNVPNAPFTVIPNDVVHLPDGTYLMSAHHVRSWDRHGAASWLTWCNRFYISREQHAENWEVANWTTPGLTGKPMQLNNDPAQEWRKFQNATFVLLDGYLYMFGTESGRTDGGGIYLSRVKWQQWHDLNAWELWGWQGGMWRWGAAAATPILMPTLPKGSIGEINAQIIEGVVVLSYCDFGVGAVTRTALRTDAVWTDAQLHATQLSVPNLYAPSVHPYSTLDKPFMHLSQWKHDFYGVKFYAMDALRRPLNLPVPESTAIGTPAPMCMDTSAMTAAELADMLTSDTAVSAADLAKELAKRM